MKLALAWLPGSGWNLGKDALVAERLTRPLGPPIGDVAPIEHDEDLGEMVHFNKSFELWDTIYRVRIFGVRILLIVCRDGLPSNLDEWRRRGVLLPRIGR